ncbi:MAG: NADP oxidoreductase [Calditerrivibrio sp.]|nr:NADP oxidoreductase [Calditerrivibrio sp.]MCA1981250.1 NADP oxidoreductase [Calditerrivibrio sp.]
MKKSLATVWLDGCSGCHMSFLDIDERLLEVSQHFDIVYSPLVDFKEFPDNVFITLVEGSVSSYEDIEKVKNIRKKTEYLVSIGDCAITGNIPSMRNTFDLKEVLNCGYAEHADISGEINFKQIPRLLKKVSPLHEVVRVDFYIPGCPPPADAFYNFLISMANNTRININDFTRFGK